MESRSSSVQRRWGQEQDPSKLTSYLQRERVAWEQWQPSVSRETEHWSLLRPRRATAPSPGALFTVLQCFFLVVVFLTQSNSTWNMTTRGLWDIKGNWAVVGCILHLVRARPWEHDRVSDDARDYDGLTLKVTANKETHGDEGLEGVEIVSDTIQNSDNPNWSLLIVETETITVTQRVTATAEGESDADDTETDGDGNTETKPGRDRCNSPVGVSCVSSLPQYQTAVGSSNYSLLCAQ